MTDPAASSVVWLDAIDVAGALLLGAAYLTAMRHVRARERWPAARAVAFGVALGLAAVATSPAVDAHARSSAAWHMGQQMMLLVLVAPALVAGRPLLLARRATGRRPGRAPGPVAAWLAFVGIQWMLHIPPVLDGIVRRPFWEGMMHIALVAAGAMFFAQVIGGGLGRLGNPLLAGIYVASAMPTTDAIALWLMLDPHVIYPAFTGPGALAAQRLAGAIMFGAGNLLLVAAGVVAGRYLWDGNRTTPGRRDLPGSAA